MKTLRVSRIIKEDEFGGKIGYFHGHWSGYHVKVNIDGNDYDIEVDKGVRGIDCPCLVFLNADGIIEVSE